MTPLAVGSWSTIATLDTAIFRNVRIDFGSSYMLTDNNTYMTAIDSAQGSGGMIRYNYTTGVLQVYSASVTTLRPIVRIVYNK